MSYDEKLLNYLSDTMYHLYMTAYYGGNLFEYLDDCGIESYDIYIEDVELGYIPRFLNAAKRLPQNFFGPGLEEKEVKIAMIEEIMAKILPIDKLQPCEKSKPMIYCGRWNWSLYQKIVSCNYKYIYLDKLVDYSLYKHVIKTCKNHVASLGAKVLLTKFPRVTDIKHRSALENYLSLNSIYGYRTEMLEEYRKMGLNVSELYDDANVSAKYENGVFRWADNQSEHINIINGLRITTDIPINAQHRIWVFGPSTVYGYLVTDDKTLSSNLQRECNEYFEGKSDYSVVNASNFYGKEVWHLVPWIKKLPIKENDICIFHLDFPEQLLERDDTIYDLNKKFERPHQYGEVFVDINHMNGNGYHAQAKEIFKILVENGYFSNETVQEVPEKLIENKTPKLTKIENIELQQYIDSLSCYRERVGAIVMNCNPFTLGHRYLVEESAKKVDKLFVFVVQEDKSYFKFDDRIELVKKGTADLKNVIVIPSGKFIISQRTFEAYSNKANLQDKVIDATMDVEIFAQHIAPSLGISVRFAGEEPLDNVTKQYNDTMSRILPEYGIEFEVIPRKEHGGSVISASRVRHLLEEKRFDAIRELVPDTTYEYLANNYN